MKLTPEDKKMLIDGGISEGDFRQMEMATSSKNITYSLIYSNSKRKEQISRKKVIELIGRREYLFAISRCAFHWTALRPVADTDKAILFDASKMFKRK